MKVPALFCALSFCCLSGCLEDMLETERQPATPPGIASPEIMDERAGGKTADSGDDPAQDSRQPAAQPTDDEKGKPSIIGRTTRNVVDVHQATEDADIVVVESEASSDNPFSAPGTVYNRVASFAGSLPLQQWIQHHHALHDRYPSHEELVAWLAKNPQVELPQLTHGRFYGYDAETGRIVVLEDRSRTHN